MKKRVLALVDDLFFSIQIKDTASALGYETDVVQRPEEFARRLEAGKAIVVVDSGSSCAEWPRLIAEAKASGHPVVVFGNHNDLGARERALAAGADAFVANAAVGMDLARLLRRFERSASGAGPRGAGGQRSGSRPAKE